MITLRKESYIAMIIACIMAIAFSFLIGTEYRAAEMERDYRSLQKQIDIQFQLFKDIAHKNNWVILSGPETDDWAFDLKENK